MTDAVSNNYSNSISALLADINLGPTSSVQLAFAKIQLAQSMICKSNAESYMKQIEEVQKDQSEVAEMISQARNLKQKAGKGNSEMPAEMVKYFKEHNLAVGSTDDNWNNSSEWDINIESLTNYQESISNKTQTLMVYL